MTLREAIEQMIALGEKDPAEIVVKLRSRHGEEWLHAEVLASADEFAAVVARQMLGAGRRSSLPAIRQQRVPADLLLRAKWVPGVGWRKIGELTASDCRAVAGHYRLLSTAAVREAHWYDDLADALEKQKVVTVAALKNPPALPPHPEAKAA